jgi:hypothetical protein
LNNQPDGLPALLGRFKNGEAVYRFVCEHLHCGALVTLPSCAPIIPRLT